MPNNAYVTEYKGHPVINLPMSNGRDFSFGLNKARAILAHYEAIKRFVETEETYRAERYAEMQAENAIAGFDA